MRELTSVAHLRDAAEDDVLPLWAAQGLTDGYRAWAGEDGAVAVTGDSGLVRYDRVVRGPAEQVRALLDELGPCKRVLGRAELLTALFGPGSGWHLTSSWTWMHTGRPVLDGPTGDAHWLPDGAWGEVEDLLGVAYPGSYTWPGMHRVTRWAGIRDGSGRLVATAADGPSAPEVGYLAGVAVHPDARGQGLADRICRFTVQNLSARHVRLALMVDDWNEAAIKIYERLGFHDRFGLRAAFPLGRLGE